MNEDGFDPLDHGSVITTEIAVVGSGAGGATTAASLAEQGRSVLILEEGSDSDTSVLASNSTEAFRHLYRNGGMTPILGRRNIGFVEGRCVGGSTEINSAFWHRLPPHCYHRWRADALLADFTPEILNPYFDRLEEALSVTTSGGRTLPESSLVLQRGAEALGWSYAEVPRCQKRDPLGNPFAGGGKQSMQRTFLPRASAAGARLAADCRVVRIAHDGRRVQHLEAEVSRDGRRHPLRIRADAFFMCGGAIQTPALLRRSRIRENVGDNLCIHPMIKVAARFEDEMDAADAPLPLYQISEFGPNITLGGSIFTPGFLAMTLAAHWEERGDLMADWERMAIYYAATRGMKRGKIRVLPGTRDGIVVRYPISRADQHNVSVGLARLGEVLFAGGATELFPSLLSQPTLHSAAQCRHFLTKPLPVSAMDLTTVHAFSSCPMGENPDFCATDSYGKVRGFENLFVNDASLIPDSPGVNPQGTTMAIALRNVDHFLAEIAG